MDTQFDRFKLPDAESEPLVFCASCGDGIYEGDEVNRTHDGEFVHNGDAECTVRYAMQHMYDRGGTIDNRGGII